ncbi:MAG: MBL fold metallo-hydrolase [Treponema sp.]|nr:MBL fold metallo-hydrolase [Treponema sp.]
MKAKTDKKIEGMVVGLVQTNCWFYPLEETQDTEKGPSGEQPCVVIDPGDEAPLLIKRLDELGWIPRYIFLSHGHFDHLFALPDLIEHYNKFLDTPPQVGIHRLDVQYLGKDAYGAHQESVRAATGSSAYLDPLWKPLPEADLIFEEGSQAGPFQILHVPGHTPGSVCFYDREGGLLFSGDTLFRMGRGRTDLPGGNEEQLHQSLARLLSMDKGTKVYPGHGAVTSIGDELQYYR